MALWIEWWNCMLPLREACSRNRTFLWMVVVMAGLCTRTDLAGITSIVRCLGLKEKAYHNLRFVCHSTAIDRRALARIWLKIALKLFKPVMVGPYIVFAGDGLKVGKEGKKMPGVKKLHQSSENNSKPKFIMGHSFQAIGLLVTGFAGCMACIPVLSKIHEGVVWSNRDTRTLLDKMANMFLEVARDAGVPSLLVADAYYATKKMIEPLLAEGFQLISRLRTTSVAFFPAKAPKKTKRGRPRLYGRKVRLVNLFEKPESFVSVASPVYGEDDVTIQYLCIDLLWRPIGKLMRFVLVKHPVRGRIMLMSSDTTLDPIQIIATYGYRFKIEVSFKQAIRILGTYAYHFWMKDMLPLTRNSGDQYMHRQSEEYRVAVRRKLHAYHVYVMLGCIAQGVILHLSLNRGQSVWGVFRGWLRTMRKDMAPSELVVSDALRTSLPEFLVCSGDDHDLAIFLRQNIEPDRAPGLSLAS